MAALPANYLTAQHMLVRVAGIRTGDTILVHLMTDNRTVSGVSLSGLWGEPLMESLKELVRLFRNGELQPVIDSKFTFARVAEAYQRIEQRKNVGKVILTPDLS